MIKLVLVILGAIAVVVSGYYFYERAQYLRMAEERAKAVGGQRLLNAAPDAASPPAQAE